MKKISEKKIVPRRNNKKRKDTEVFPVERENPVYVKMGYYESLESKRDLLSSQISFLNMLKILKRYNSLRLEELRIKSEINKAIRELDVLIKKTKSSFPFLKIPERARRQEIIEMEPEKKAVQLTKPIREAVFDNDLESQLKSIQDKLKSMGR